MSKKKFLLIFLITLLGLIFLLIQEDQVEKEDELKQADGLVEDEAVFFLPLDNLQDRVIKKGFGIYITPQNSPIQPERFTGYHTGVDFEIFPEELDEPVVVYALCSGRLGFKDKVNGYGGLVVHNCLLNNKSITVIYGHLKLTSVNFEIGQAITKGDLIGLLGAAGTQETDGERKHLHLGIHQGIVTDIRGYIGLESDLKDWFDFCDYGC